MACRGIEWDSVMNYDAFMEPLTWFLTGMEKHSDEYKDYMLGNTENFEECDDITIWQVLEHRLYSAR